MKFIIVFFLAVGGFLGNPACAAADAGRSPRPEQFAGKWSRGDGTGYNVTITFHPDLSYTAVWEGCLGTYGTARGTWRIRDRQIVFTPAEEEGMMRKHLRTLDVAQVGSSVVLVPPDVRREFKKYGRSSRFWCFQYIEDQ